MGGGISPLPFFDPTLPPLLLILTALLALSCNRKPQPAAVATYAPAATCLACHAEIAASYGKTGMARSFTAFDPAKTRADFTRRNRFTHKASGRTYTMTLRGGAAYMRRHELDDNGRETNILEKRIDYILGSGLKAQTMLHRTARGELVEMPVAWYTANDGYWAMNPSYDRPDHADFRRPVRYDCFFCHNAYPAGIADDSFLADAIYPPNLPSGIDCQRCHGPAAAHVEAASQKAPADRIRAAVVNPKRLPRERQLETCYQCHLQSTSSPLPHVVTRLGRGVFSYRAGEPLSGYALFFDHPAGSGRDGKFEIAHAAYRLRQSACFVKSAMTCTTCHNPHKAAPAGSAPCRQCHAQPSAPAHSNVTECLSCHMPQRRTDDVVEVVMTDHHIVRRAPANLTAPKTESHGPPYRGPVAAYYPAEAGALHTAVAQVRMAANLPQGLAMLEKAVAADPHCPAECYYELADAYARSGDHARARHAGAEALRRAPENPWILRAYGSLLSSQADTEQGTQLLEKARAKLGSDPATLHALALSRRSIDLLEQARQADPDSVEVNFALGEILYQRGGLAGAESAFRAAIRAKPDYALAHFNIASILLQKGADALYHLRRAAALAPRNASIRHTYGVALASQRRTKEAAVELEAAATLDPASARTHLALGMVLAELGQWPRAQQFLERAAASGDAEIRTQAEEVIRRRR